MTSPTSRTLRDRARGALIGTALGDPAPAGLVAAGDLDRVAEIARDQALVTHAHPLGVDGAVLAATAIPGRLLERLEAVDALRDLADRLSALTETDQSG